MKCERCGCNVESVCAEIHFLKSDLRKAKHKHKRNCVDALVAKNVTLLQAYKDAKQSMIEHRKFHIELPPELFSSIEKWLEKWGNYAN